MAEGLGVRGVRVANAVLQGPRARRDSDVRVGLQGAGARPVGDLRLDGYAHAHVHGGVLQTDGWLVGADVLRADFKGQLPIQAISTQPPNAPVQFDARLAQLDLARLGQV